MNDHQVLLDAFAEARRSWDDLVACSPTSTLAAVT